MTQKMINIFLIILLACMSKYSNSETMMVHVNVKNNQHQIMKAWLIDKDLPPSFFIKGRHDDIKLDVFDAQQNILTTQYVNKPSPIFGAYILATEKEKKDLNQRTMLNNESSYYIRIPNYNVGMRSLQLSYLQDVATNSQRHHKVNKSAKRVNSKLFILKNM